MKKWTTERKNYVVAQHGSGHSAKSIAAELGCTEASIWHVLRDRKRDSLQPEDIFSYADVSTVTGIPVKEIHNLIVESKLRGNGTVGRKDLVNFLCRYPGSCEKGNVVQIIYLLGGEKCSPNLK